MHRLSRLALTLAVALGGLSVTAVGAQAAKPHHGHKLVVIKSGTTTITPTAATVQFLTSHGVAVTALSPATLQNGAVTLPVRVGVATRSLHGALLHRGGVQFSNTKGKVTIRAIVLSRLGARTLLSGRVNGHREIGLARLTHAKLTRSGKQVTLTGELRLTAGAARRIDHLLGKHLVKAGYDLGSLTSQLTLR